MPMARSTGLPASPMREARQTSHRRAWQRGSSGLAGWTGLPAALRTPAKPGHASRMARTSSGERFVTPRSNTSDCWNDCQFGVGVGTDQLGDVADRRRLNLGLVAPGGHAGAFRLQACQSTGRLVSLTGEARPTLNGRRRCNTSAIVERNRGTSLSSGAFPRYNTARSFRRGRLPTCEVRIRSTLRFTCVSFRAVNGQLRS